MTARTVAAAIERPLGEPWMPRVSHWEIATTDDVWGAHAELDVRAEDRAYQEFRALAWFEDTAFTDDGRQIRIDFEYDDVPVRVWWLRPVLRWIVPETCATCPTKLGGPDVPFVRLGDGADRREAPVICVACRDVMHAAWLEQSASAGAMAADGALTPGAYVRMRAALGVMHAARRRHGTGAVPVVQALEAAGLLQSPALAARDERLRSEDKLGAALNHVDGLTKRVTALETERHDTNTVLDEVVRALRTKQGAGITESANELERQFILSGDRLIPRTKLLRLLREWAAARTGGDQ